MSTRRSFLALSAATITASALPRSLFAQVRRPEDVFSNAALGAARQGNLTQAAFEKLIGSTFTAFLDDDQVAYLRLLNVTVPPPKPDKLKLVGTMRTMLPILATPASPAPALTTFMIQFEITGKPFPQGTYLLDHGTMGRFSILLVPGGTGTCTSTFCSFAQA